ncbi:hypothetical protein CJ030_MR5G025020 [Morella rubra]|uniref:Uncharacterized protein n=1 Tax=Morella rubra TaxID=262757 RepID=A0A6A1VHA8_9ROSI|nr:hypothetical protein CJ030_MR5G025020 [Morella rubra]
MEEHKMWYLKAFIGRTKESMGFYVELVEKKEARLRRCYSEKIQCSSDKFIKIILVDAAFIIELLLRFYFKELNDENDCISNRPWMRRDIWRDMILLENQLPFFILEDLYNASKKLFQSFQNEEKPSILKLSHFFFKNVLRSLKGTEEHKLEDVDLLVKYGIMEKRSDINEGANHIQNFSRGAVFSSGNFHFVSLCEDLNTYCRASWHEWIKTKLLQHAMGHHFFYCSCCSPSPHSNTDGEFCDFHKLGQSNSKM